MLEKRPKRSRKCQNVDGKSYQFSKIASDFVLSANFDREKLFRNFAISFSELILNLLSDLRKSVTSTTSLPTKFCQNVVGNLKLQNRKL